MGHGEGAWSGSAHRSRCLRIERCGAHVARGHRGRTHPCGAWRFGPGALRPPGRCRGPAVVLPAGPRPVRWPQSRPEKWSQVEQRLLKDVRPACMSSPEPRPERRGMAFRRVPGHGVLAEGAAGRHNAAGTGRAAVRARSMRTELSNRSPGRCRDGYRDWPGPLITWRRPTRRRALPTRPSRTRGGGGGHVRGNTPPIPSHPTGAGRAGRRATGGPAPPPPHPPVAALSLPFASRHTPRRARPLRHGRTPRRGRCTPLLRTRPRSVPSPPVACALLPRAACCPPSMGRS